MLRALAFAIATTLVVPITVAACGPSVQSIYEGNVRFEHCYRLDLDLDIAPSHREVCWKQWLKVYTYGQPRDRIDYARRRVRAFATGDLSRPTLKLGAARRPEERQFYLSVPAPTSPHAPPPPVATRVVEEPRPAPPATEPPESAPGATCASDCQNAWRSCQEACGGAGAMGGAGGRVGQSGSGDPACKSCEPDYKTCMRRCFE